MKNTRNFSEIRLNTTFHAFKRKTFSWRKEYSEKEQKTRIQLMKPKEKKKHEEEEGGRTSDGRDPRTDRSKGETRDDTQKNIFIKHLFSVGVPFNAMAFFDQRRAFCWPNFKSRAGLDICENNVNGPPAQRVWHRPHSRTQNNRTLAKKWEPYLKYYKMVYENFRSN